MKIRHAVAAFLLLSCPTFAQQKPQPQHKTQNQGAAADRLGMTCPQILAMSSTDWIAKFAQVNASAADRELRAIRVYGRCYDARTDQLAASLARKGAGPKNSALVNLKDFEHELDAFTAKTFADVDPPPPSVKTAYAALYQKQFRYEFYQAYDQKELKPGTPPGPSKPAIEKNTQTQAAQPKAASGTTPAAAPGANSANLPPPTAPSKVPLSGIPPKRTFAPAPGSAPAVAADTASASPPAGASAEVAGAEPTSKDKDVDPFTKAKNHFGELLGMLPEEKVHDVHSAFGKLFSGNPVSEDMKYEVYCYAIFLLEKPSDQTFAPPPF
jgi:hypothetical protein